MIKGKNNLMRTILLFIYTGMCVCVCVVEFSPETLNTYCNSNTMVLNKENILYLYGIGRIGVGRIICYYYNCFLFYFIFCDAKLNCQQPLLQCSCHMIL